MPDWPAILAELSAAAGPHTLRSDPAPIGGGDISAAWRVPAESGDLFVKTGPRAAVFMFEAEVAGLTAIAESGAIRVPKVVGTGLTGSNAWLALEWLDLAPTSSGTDAKLGQQLATLHQKSADQYGWDQDNSIGLTPQRNTWSDSWSEFFCEQRLGAQLRLAGSNGYTGRLQNSGAELLGITPGILDSGAIVPSLLHGDLWSGNYASCNGSPVVFDPAVYYGDPETDLAMTRLFGGFSETFYSAYHSILPRRDGHESRCDLYQLYHVLNHLNMFGSAYLGRAQQIIDRLLAGET